MRLARGFVCNGFFGGSLVGSAGVNCCFRGFGAHCAVFALAVEEEPATGYKDQGCDDKYS